MSGLVDVAVFWGDQLLSFERMSAQRAVSIGAWPGTRVVIQPSTPSPSVARATFDWRLLGCIVVSIASHAAVVAFHAATPAPTAFFAWTPQVENGPTRLVSGRTRHASITPPQA